MRLWRRTTSRLVAVETARRLVVGNGAPVKSLDPTDVQEWGSHWTVVFDLALPEGEVMDPSDVIVDVSKATGKAELFSTL